VATISEALHACIFGVPCEYKKLWATHLLFRTLLTLSFGIRNGRLDHFFHDNVSDPVSFHPLGLLSGESSHCRLGQSRFVPTVEFDIILCVIRAVVSRK
jgi:hypothetical protein